MELGRGGEQKRVENGARRVHQSVAVPIERADTPQRVVPSRCDAGSWRAVHPNGYIAFPDGIDVQPLRVRDAYVGHQRRVAKQRVNLPVVGIVGRAAGSDGPVAGSEHLAHRGCVLCRCRSVGVEQAVVGTFKACVVLREQRGVPFAPDAPVVVFVPQGLVAGADDSHSAASALPQQMLSKAVTDDFVGSATVVYGDEETAVGWQGVEEVLAYARIQPACGYAVGGIVYQPHALTDVAFDGLAQRVGRGVVVAYCIVLAVVFYYARFQIVHLSVGDCGRGLGLLLAGHQQASVQITAVGQHKSLVAKGFVDYLPHCGRVACRKAPNQRVGQIVARKLGIVEVGLMHKKALDVVLGVPYAYLLNVACKQYEQWGRMAGRGVVVALLEVALDCLFVRRFAVVLLDAEAFLPFPGNERLQHLAEFGRRNYEISDWNIACCKDIGIGFRRCLAVFGQWVALQWLKVSLDVFA